MDKYDKQFRLIRIRNSGTEKYVYGSYYGQVK